MRSLLIALGLAACAVTAGEKNDDGNKKRQVVKVVAESDEGVEVFVKNNKDKNKFSFTFDELDDMTAVEDKLAELDPEVKTQVLELLGKLSEHDAKHITLKSAELARGDRESEIIVLKTFDGEDNMHIEIDVEGDAAGKGHMKHVHKMMSKGDRRMHKGGKKDIKKGLKRMIESGKLSQDDIAELRAILDGAQ